VRERVLTALTPEREAELLAALRGSGPARERATHELFVALRRPVLSICLGMSGGDEAAAEDALQETFLAIFRQVEHFRGESKLTTWACTIAVRTALSARAKTRQRSHEPLNAAAGIVDESPSPEGTAAGRQAARRMQAAMAQLSAEHRAVISLFAVEGLSHQAIAEVLGIPQGTVWSRLHLARKRLIELAAL
jgi:RNA polymerase sigma-70 factor (ECF subfamily)